MPRRLDRRRFIAGLVATPALPVLSSLLGEGALDGPSSAAPAPSHFPHQDPELVREVVGAAHRDLERVRALVEARPALARASWDWGFGDWESALGAASHVGRADIAHFLMAHGARPNLFTWAMLGRLPLVRAAVEAAPGVEAIPGPHGITLLAHARAGGDFAADVSAYLEALGTADPRPTNLTLSAEEIAEWTGTFAFGSATADRLEVVEHRGGLRVHIPPGGVARNLLYQGEGMFHPAGVPFVRLRFEPRAGRAERVVITDADVRLEAARVG